jgi:hypothetical protein
MARAYTTTETEVKGNNKYMFDPAITPGEAIRTTLLNRISWGAVFAGVVMGFAVQVILNLIGAGIGLVSLDTAQQAMSPAFSWTSVIWWTVAGVVAAFAGGFTAGRLAGEPKEDTAGWHGLISWAVSFLFVVVLMTTAAGAAMNMGSPIQVIMDQGVVTVVPPDTTTATAPSITAQEYGPAQPAAPTATAEETPAVSADALAAAALVSAAALLIGACAAWCGGLAGTVKRGRETTLVEKRENVTFQ